MYFTCTSIVLLLYFYCTSMYFTSSRTLRTFDVFYCILCMYSAEGENGECTLTYLGNHQPVDGFVRLQPSCWILQYSTSAAISSSAAPPVAPAIPSPVAPILLPCCLIYIYYIGEFGHLRERERETAGSCHGSPLTSPRREMYCR